MEDAGVGRQVLSPNHPPYLPDETECVTAVKILNDAYAEFARRFPDRISSYVMPTSSVAMLPFNATLTR